MQITFKSDKQIAQFTCKHFCIYRNISSVFLNRRNVSNTFRTEIKKQVLWSICFETLSHFK